jgi:hypothetical protein
VHVELGAVYTATADDELVHAGVADHHAGHVVRCIGAFANSTRESLDGLAEEGKPHVHSAPSAFSVPLTLIRLRTWDGL